MKIIKQLRQHRFLIIGLGSMGKRRIRNLLSLKIKPEQIAGFDLDQTRTMAVAKEYHIPTFSSYETAILEHQPTVDIISTPPNLHASFFLAAIKANRHFFCEVGSTNEGYTELLKILKQKPAIVAIPSCTMRFFSPIVAIKKLLDQKAIGDVLYLTHHFGMYLPDWHPWEDYRKFYAAKVESSAIREMVPYELQWLSWLLPEPFISVTGKISKLSNLEMSAPDFAVAQITTASGTMLNLTIEVLARAPLRALRIIGSEGTLEWDWQQWQIRYFQSKTKKWKLLNIPKEEPRKEYVAATEAMYEREMKAFLDQLIMKHPYPYDFEVEQRHLHLLAQLERKQS